MKKQNNVVTIIVIICVFFRKFASHSRANDIYKETIMHFKSWVNFKSNNQRLSYST